MSIVGAIMGFRNNLNGVEPLKSLIGVNPCLGRQAGVMLTNERARKYKELIKNILKYLALLASLNICLGGPNVTAQNPRIDSLRQITEQYDPSSTDYIDAINVLALEIRNFATDESFELRTRALALSRDLSYPRGEALAQLGLGFYYRTRDLDSALVLTLEALNIFVVLQDTIQTITCHYNLRSIYGRKNMLVKSIEHGLEALRLSQLINDTKWLVLNHAAVGRRFIDLGELEKAEMHFEQALRFASNTTNQGPWMHSQIGVALIANIRGNHDVALRGYEKIYRYAVSISDKNAQREILRDMAETMLMKEDFDSSLYYIEKYESLIEDSNTENFFLTADLLRTRLSFQSGNIPDAIEYGTQLAKKLERQSIRDQHHSVHHILAKAYAQIGDYPQAYSSSQKYQTYRDSLNESETAKQTARLAFERTLELKENEISLLSKNEALVRDQVRQQRRILWITAAGIGLLSLALYLLWKNNMRRQITNSELSSTLKTLKSTQTQLIHSEKMASLGELTAGIAHEIQNPLNFVNNFSDVSGELLSEVEEELADGNIEEAGEIIVDLKENLSKINHHGTRASGIVQGMLAHSRTGSGEKAPTDINKMMDEYLRLAYHGLRAKDKSFNADFTTDLDPDLPLVNVVAQDMGRVILNLINNAFYTVDKRKLAGGEKDYLPSVLVSTNVDDENVVIRVQDNGQGMSPEIVEKIFQPFFTTKPTGEGTGLGLSLSYDIVTKGHGGTLTVESEEGIGSTFMISLPVIR